MPGKLRDVAEKAGVSLATASLVLNQRPCRIAEPTRQRVLSAAAELGLAPGGAMVAIMLPDIENPFFANLGQAFLEESQHLGLHALMMVHTDRPQQDAENLDSLLAKGVNGVVLVRSSRSTRQDDQRLLEKLRRKNIPVVVMDRRMEGPNTRSILVDNRAGAHMAVKYLLEQGHTRIGCITGPSEDGVSHERLQGYRDALAEFAIPYDPSLICSGAFRMEDGSRFLPYLLGRSITALFCFNDNVALGVYTACRAYRLKIPENLSVIGFDGIPIGEILDVPLSTVLQPAKEMGCAAAQLLQTMLRSPTQAESIVFQPTLQIRASTAPVPPPLLP